MHKAVHPPERPRRPERTRSERTVRIVPPSPALSVANLEAVNESTDSLSSVYSRSVSGETHSPQPSLRHATYNAGSRSYSSSSTATVKKSHLGIMRLASNPDVIVIAEEKSRSSTDRSDSDIDNVATLQAKLPSVKVVSDFGEINNWRISRLDATTDTNFERFYFTPLNIVKTRHSREMFQIHAIAAIV